MTDDDRGKTHFYGDDCDPPHIPPRPPWVNEDGSTNVDGWIAAYTEDDNTFWRTEQGHIMNVVDALLERLDL